MKITSVSGVSKFVNETDGSVTIYGGIQAGAVATSYAGCSATGGACDTCIGNAANATVRQAPCNLTGVFKETVITITGSQTTNLANGKFFLCNGTTEIEATANLGETMSLTWEQLCELATSNANLDCSTTNMSQTLTFGVGTACNNLGTEVTNLKVITRFVNIDPTADVIADNTYVPPLAATPPTPDTCSVGQGACYFKVFPGDGKVYLDPDVGVGIALNFPATEATSVTYDKLVLFYQETGLADPTDTSQDIATFNAITTAANLGTITVTSTGGISTASLGGLTNEKRYCFKMGSQDTTGNIDHISSQDCDVTYNPDGAAACSTVCTSPSEVVGLLSDTSCFIATAAFGSRLDPHVQMLRDFKKQFLLSNWLGRQVVKIYYTFSPDLAQWIAQNENLRSAARTILWPVVWLVQVIMYFGLSILLLPIGFVGGAFVFKKWRQA